MTSSVKLPLDLITTLISAEHRSIGKQLRHGYEKNVVWCNLAPYTGPYEIQGESDFHLYRWDGDAIWYKRGMLGSDWTQRYSISTSGNHNTGTYTICTGIAPSPIVKATFQRQRLCSIYTGSRLAATPEPALIYADEAFTTHLRYGDNRDPDDNLVIPYKVKHPKEYYYYQGKDGYNMKDTVRAIKGDYIAERLMSNKRVTLAAVEQLLGKGDYNWTTYDWCKNAYITRRVLLWKSKDKYDLSGRKKEGDERYDDRSVLEVTGLSETDLGTTITLTGVEDCQIDSLTVFDPANGEAAAAHTNVVWKV